MSKYIGFLNITGSTLPIEDPVLKFLLELLIILSAPLLLNKIKVPHLLGLIIAGAIVGPNGLNLLARDSSIVVTGTTGLLYIMFLAGLEIDMGDFKKNKWKSITFSIYTFVAPFLLGFVGGYYICGFSLLTSILFASLFSSHTLITYPLVSKLGLAKNLSVNLTVGGTMITDVLSLLVLAVVVGMTQGEVGSAFWIKLSLSMLLFGLVVLLIFPLVGRWFFKRVEDKISQYIFVLVIIYLAAVLAELAGIEAIIGAFFAGLALNRLIPRTSSLMNRVEFVGNAIFIPFFLISVGMLIDFKAFFKSWETLAVAGIMLVASIGGKYIAAVATQKTFRLSKQDGLLIFGMTSASAAATLASVMVGFNIIISETPNGEPVRLLNEHVLNGSILLILISCTISSFLTMASAERIAEEGIEDTVSGSKEEEEGILLAVNHEEIVEKMVNLALLLKAPGNKDRIFALNVINEDKSESSVKNAEKILELSVKTAAAADITLQPLKRYDNNVVSGIHNVIKEQEVTDLLIGLKADKGFSASFIDNLYNGYLQNEQVNILVYRAIQPIATVKKYIILIPAHAEREAGFFHALLRIWNIARHSGATMHFYATTAVNMLLHRIQNKAHIEAEFHEMESWHASEMLLSAASENEGVIILMAKPHTQAYIPLMRSLPEWLNSRFHNSNYLLIYPFSEAEGRETEKRAVGNHRDFMEIGRVIANLFK